MEGAARAANRRSDANTVLAYQALSFYGLSIKGKLKGLNDYLIEKPKPPRPQTPDEMFAVLQMAIAGGAPMTVRELN